jgi:hypothetical protein
MDDLGDIKCVYFQNVTDVNMKQRENSTKAHIPGLSHNHSHRHSHSLFIP